MEHSRPGRCKSAVAPEEKTDDALKDHSARDIYALGALIKSVMKGISEKGKTLPSRYQLDGAELFPYVDLPHADDFVALADARMRSANPNHRPKAREILSHPFFSHDYVAIVRFLSDLPLKSEAEKRQFFGGLVPR